MRRIIIMLTHILLIMGIGIAAAQDPGPDRAETAKKRMEALAKGNAELPALTRPGVTDEHGLVDPMLPVGPGLIMEKATRAKYEEALRVYYDYTMEGLNHRSDVFEWQLFSARLIFVTVVLLVAFGIYFAAVQFHVGLRRKASPETGEKESTAPAVTKISASLEGVQVTSPVLGVIILVISLAFFYMYLVFVYPIENVF